MTGAEALNLLMGRMNRSNATLRANCLLEMKQYQETQLEKGEELPDFLFTYDVTVALTAANRRFTLPTDFLRFEDEDDTLWILDDDSEYRRMERVGFDDPQYDRSETGSLPLKYSMRGLYGYTFPIPTANRTMKMNYFAKGSTLADDATTNVWLTHASDLLIGGTGLVITSLYVKDNEAAAIFAAMEARGRQRLLNETTARAEAGRSRRMG